MKKILIILLSLVCICNMIWPSALESYNYYDFMDGGICYDIVNDSQVVVTTGKYAQREWGSLVYYSRYDNTTSITIPEKVTNYAASQSYDVVGIKYEALSGCYKLTSVTISNSVKDIGSKAFYNSYNLTTIYMGEGITSIGSDAFSQCNKLKNVYISNLTSWCNISFESSSSNPLCIATNLYLNEELLTGNLEIPDGITSIGDYLFMGFNGITSVTIPNSVTSIGNMAFYNCSGLTSMEIPNGVTILGNYAFAGCKGLTSIDLSNSITSIGNRAFEDCYALTSVSIPNSVTSIGEWVFAYCTSLTSITIPNSVKSIGECAFMGCKALKSVIWNAVHCQDFPDDYVGPFYSIKSRITSFIIGDEVEYIPTYLCYGMSNVPEIFIPNCKVEIGEPAFSGCKSVKINKLPDNILTTIRHEYDIFNSGSISISFATETAFSYYSYAGNYYYSLNGVKNASLNNLSAGNYHLVIYGDICGDSIVRDVTINRYGMNVDNNYYLLNEENHTATLTYRGESPFSYVEYSGDIIIPEIALFNGEEYRVTGVRYDAFVGCDINSITLKSENPIEIVGGNQILQWVGDAADLYGYFYYRNAIYVPFGSLARYKIAYADLNFRVLNPDNTVIETSATSAAIAMGNADERKHIKACGLVDGAEFGGNVVEYSGLEPNSTYADVPFYVKTIEGDSDVVVLSFTTSDLELTTSASKPVSANTAILLASTNMSDIETNCGFEWKRNDAPADMEGTKSYCPVANGVMAGRLKGLKDDVYYKYRAFYQSAAGNMYYGDWQYIFTGDNAVEFDPVLYTYEATAVTEHEATLKGYALEGSDDFDEQGFEYWAESRVTSSNTSARKAVIGEKQTIPVSGIAMKVTLTDLDEGTVYKYRTYAKFGDQTVYGAEMSFTTQGEYQEPTGVDKIKESSTSEIVKFVRNGQFYIMYEGQMYDVRGMRVE